MTVSTTVDERSERPSIDQASKSPKTKKKSQKERRDTLLRERRDPLYSEILEWLQEFRENLVDDEIPEQGDSHASDSHEVSLEPTFKRSEDLGKHSVYTHAGCKTAAVWQEVLSRLSVRQTSPSKRDKAQRDSPISSTNLGDLQQWRTIQARISSILWDAAAVERPRRTSSQPMTTSTSTGRWCPFSTFYRLPQQFGRQSSPNNKCPAKVGRQCHTGTFGQYHIITRSAWKTFHGHSQLLWHIPECHASGKVTTRKNKRRQRSRRRQRRWPKSRRHSVPMAGEKVRHRRDCSDTMEETSFDEALLLRSNLRSERERNLSGHPLS